VAAAARAGALPRKRQRARLPPGGGECPLHPLPLRRFFRSSFASPGGPRPCREPGPGGHIRAKRSSGLDKGRRPRKLSGDRAASGLPALARGGPPRGFPCQVRCGPGAGARQRALDLFVKKLLTAHGTGGCQFSAIRAAYSYGLQGQSNVAHAVLAV
jgi:hypothetical protein